MSKLAQLITHTVTGNVRASRDLNFRYTTAETYSKDVNHGFEKQIRLSVTLKHDVFLSDSIVNNPDNFHAALYDLKRAMIEEIFGEFRPLIIELRSSLYEDKDRTRLLLAELEHKMFMDGL